MARKRIIDPNIWESEDFSSLSMLGKVLFIGLFSIADDEGRGKANPVYIRSKLFPYTAEEVRLADIKTALSEIAHRMSVTFYTVNGAQYYALTHWENWQKIDRPTPSTIPDPKEGEAIIDDSTNARRVLDERSTSPRRVLDEGSSLIEKNRKEENKNRTEESERTPATVEDVIAYSRTLDKSVPENECHAFFDHFSSNGWRVSGKTPMKDWKASFRYWVRNIGAFAPKNTTQNYAQHERTDEGWSDMEKKIFANLDA